MVASFQTVPSTIRPVIPGLVQTAEKIVLPPPASTLTNSSLARLIPQGSLKAVSGISVSSQVRYAHTDIQIPDFSAYRRKSLTDHSATPEDSAASRKAFTYMMVAAGSIPTAYAAKTLVTQFVSSMSASADVLALAKIDQASIYLKGKMPHLNGGENHCL